ncbi:MAG: hypothetical protein WC868_07245, partial [Bacteroidales bacterium]
MLPKLNSLFVFIVILFLISCTGNQNDNNSKSVFRYNETAGISSLDPAYSKDQACIWATNQIYNGLVQLNEKLRILPCIAESWEISHNGLIYTFHLRSDVFFH